jgi:putative ABC transport system permease protein
MWKDFRLGLRRRRHSPGATFVILISLTLGIGATTMMLTLVKSVLLSPLPFGEAEHLTRISSLQNGGQAWQTWPVSYPDFLDWRTHNRSFAELSVFSDVFSWKTEGPEGPEMIEGEMVSANYFRLLRVRPLLGRTFLPDEDTKPGGDNVVVLGHELWRRRFGSDPLVLGKSFDLNEVPYVVIGVMPDRFQGMSDKAQVWVPISMATTVPNLALDSRKFRWLSVVGRLRSGQTVPDARRDLEKIAADLGREYPETNRDIGISVESLAEAWFGEIRPILLLLLGGALLVLLISYGNVSNLWLAEIIGRRPEVCLRAALGADRGRLVLQFMAETLPLTLGGLILGASAAAFGIQALVRTADLQFRSFIRIEPDPFVLGTISGLTLLCGLLFGSIPAFVGIGSRPGDLPQTGQAATEDRGRRRLQSLILVYEVTLATALLVGANLMVRDFLRLSRIDLGFRVENLLTIRAATQGQAYASDERLWSIIAEATDPLQGLAGVEAIAFAAPAIPTDDWHGFHITPEDPRASDPESQVLILRHHVSPGYFRTLGVPLLQGRDFSPDDRSGTLPVVVLSQVAATLIWPQENPLGKRLKLGARDSKFPWMTVVGVVGNIKHEGRGTGARPGPDIYLPFLQSVARNPPVLNLLVRSSGPPAALAPAVIREFRKAAPSLPVYDIRTMEERLADQIHEKKLFTLLMVTSASLALLLALVGMYSVISCLLNQRGRELGIRMALGATSIDLVGLCVWQGVRLALAGVTVGILLILALRGLAQGFLQEIGALDPHLVLGISLAILTLVAAACYIPARRALKISSLAALTRGVWGG